MKFDTPEDIGAEDTPIRASLLPDLFKCSKMFYEKTTQDGELGSSEAADTGNLAHVGIQAYHTLGGKLPTVLAAIKSAKAADYKEGDADRALAFVEKYIERCKQEKRGKVIRTEWKVKISIPCHPLDPTGKDIWITGTVDQVRDLGDTYYVVDHKTGYTPGASMLQIYAPQQAVYMLGTAQAYPDKKVLSYITRLQDLARKDLPFWWRMPFTVAQCLTVLQPVQEKIAMLRASRLQSATPGKHCEWCPKQVFPGCVTGETIESTPGRVVSSPRIALQTAAQLFGE